MYVEAILKVPERQMGDWLAITRVTPDGDITSLGYLDPKIIPLVVETLRSNRHPVTWEAVEACDQFVHWVEVVAQLRKESNQ